MPAADGRRRRPASPPASRRVPSWVSGAILLGTFAALAVAETRRPLRVQRHGKARRDLRNLAVAALSAATLQALERPVVDPLARAVERRRWGLLQRLPLPRWAEIPLAVALMDWTLTLWHVAAHRIPFLWRLHQVHHTDLDMDASTALRFHAAEMAASVPYRAAQVALIGVGPRALSVWQTFLFASVLFHHSNLRLPARLERALSALIVTPRMHGIHHSAVEAETNSNWSSGLTLWDRLHGTLRRDVPQRAIAIGVPAWRRPEELTLGRLLAMPFRRQRPTWRLEGRGPEIRDRGAAAARLTARG
jgi:sterol desaturase/sphingolipid hydroxylase (fatty acid hydroxylase superfamily)